MVVPTPSRHLVEWYLSDLTDAAVADMVTTLEAACADTAPTSRVRLVVTMAVPTDEVFYVVFAAPSAAVVVDVCSRAGLPPQRVTPDVDARVHREDVS